MPIAAGEFLGPYRIVALIGEGGMGEVYRARDPRLGREVAIKISKEQFTERFEREARAVAALNQPNVCLLYDVGPNYLVMEYIEGESPKGPLPLDEALRITRQIADALEAAHEKGIVHRDLKPANIKIKPDGTVKVLDFGLATSAAIPAADPAESPTMLSAHTYAGMILGTAAYMSPEQARGKPVDKRADIWAFGVVLYELLTGERPFRGEDVTEKLASVVKDSPDLGKAPPTVRRLLTRCLEKDPRKRLRDIGDVWELLGSEEEPATLRRGSLVKMQWGVIALLAAGLAYTLVQKKVSTETAVRFQMPASEGAGTPMPTVSPDGRKVVYQERGRLWVRAFDSLEPLALPGTEGILVTNPFWSADSRFIFFGGLGTLRKIEANGGPAQILCSLPGVLAGGFTAPDGRVIFGSTRPAGIFQVPSTGGPASALPGDRPPGLFRLLGGNPLLPDRIHLLISSQSGIYLSSINGRDGVRKLLSDASASAYIQSESKRGYLLFIRGGALLAQAFSPSKLEFSGEPIPVANNVSQFTAAVNGALVYRTGSGLRKLTWFDRQGKPSSTSLTEGEFLELTLSPDGSHVAFDRVVRIFNHDFRTEATTPLATDGRFGTNGRAKPVWSPDGKTIVFASFETGSLDLYETPSDGGNSMPLLKSEAIKTPWDWSRDGRWLLYSVTDPQTRDDLWLLPMQGERKPVPFLVTGFSESAGAFSPDGHYIAYVSDESGEPEVYVRSFAASSGGKWQISSGGGYQPRWRRDGRELFYFERDGRFMSAEITAGATFHASVPRFLFKAPIYGGGATTDNHYWDLAPDGQSFLINTVENGAASSQVTVALNWLAGLK